MDFTMGMRCPVCKEEGNFAGGQFGMVGGCLVNYNCCHCDFSASLVVPNKGYDTFRLEFLKNKV